MAEPYVDNIDYLRDEIRRLDLLAGASDREAHLLQAGIHARLAADPESPTLRLPRLARVFGLAPFETDVLLMALASRMDGNRSTPKVEDALRDLCRTDHERVQALRFFRPAMPLLRWKLLRGNPFDFVPKSQFDLDHRIADFILGGDHMDARLVAELDVAHWVTPRLGFDDLLFPEATLDRLRSLPGAAICLLHGSPGSGRRSAAEAVCRERARPQLVVDAGALLALHERVPEALEIALREARLYGGIPLLENWHTLQGSEPSTVQMKTRAQIELRRFGGPVFVSAETSFAIETGAPLLAIRTEVPDQTTRRRLWERAVSRRPDLGAIDVEFLARAYRFTGGQIARVVATLPPEASPTTVTLGAACREESGRHLIRHARRQTSVRTWDDLILPNRTLEQLQELCDTARYRHRVFQEWGFAKKLSLGKGLTALFTGPSGTGKTLSAEVLATALGVEVYRVDLSSVVSKYIGETEKNLASIFDDAWQSESILFFDEADSLFGKRTEVRDAHDRYANAEVNFLLQRVEAHDGIVVLATNMSNNIDAAFLRRMQFLIEFPLPEEDDRARLWRGVFPPEAPLSDDIEFDFLARKFKLTGGGIKNVVLAAAFHAASNGELISMHHLILALRREYQKQGKVCERSEFERYYELVRQ